MRTRGHKASVPKRRNAPGALPGKGSAPDARYVRPRFLHLHYAPLNGRAFAIVRQPLSMFARARVFRVRARRIESVRRPFTFANAMNLLFEVLLQVEVPLLGNVRTLRASGACSPAGECPRRARSIGILAFVCCACAVLYGFMKCKADCISSLICVSYLEKNFSNCTVSWRKPVGVAAVRTNDSCPMVRKDTNSKSR